MESIKSALLKDIFREIKHTRSRFISIFAIIALGAGFFAGLKATCPDMLMTEAAYYRDNNLMDIRLVSTYGFSDEDIDAVLENENIRSIYPSYFKDVFVKNDLNTDIIARVMALPDESSASYADTTINKPILIEGRFPKSSDECVVEKHNQMKVKYEVGDVISFFTTDSDDPLSDTLERSSYSVVGIVMDPMYISYERGSTDIGSGSINTFVLVPESNFVTDVYTELFLTLKSTHGLDPFEDEYEEKIDLAVDEFKAIADVRGPLRLEEIKKEAREKIDEAKADIEDGKSKVADAEEKLADGEKELKDALEELVSGEKELTDGRDEYEKGLKEFNEEIDDAQKKLDDAKDELSDGWAQYYSGVKKLESSEEEFNKGLEEAGMTVSLAETSIIQINSGLKTAEETKVSLTSAIEQMEALAQYDSSILSSEDYLTAKQGLEQVEATIEQLGAQKAELEKITSGYKAIQDGKKELEKAKTKLLQGEIEYLEGYQEFLEEKNKAQKKLDDASEDIEDGEKELDYGWDEYEKGLEEYEDAKEEAEAELADAKQKIKDGEKEIEDAEKDIAELKTPKWYVFTRDDNPGYSTFESDAYRVESVCKIFPIFFLLVAVLVCLTTMTRMVEEKRTEIGTFKALGYSKFAIAEKFIIYSLFASLSGSVIGIAVGIVIFPKIIYSAYAMMYKTPSLKLGAMPELWAIIVATCLMATTFAAIMACMSELRSSPSVLMRPKAPKAGKRVLLERIPFIWNKLNFTRKVTIRNLFRYKKRIFMTVIGIAGCTALILTGIGLYSSIGVIVDKQYSDIFLYDLAVSIDTDSDDEEVNTLLNEISENGYITESKRVFAKGISMQGTSDLTIIIPETTDGINDFVMLKDRLTGIKYPLTNSGVIITERLHEILDINVGDEITFTVDDEDITAEVNAICENYAGHLVYMTKDLYEKKTGHVPEWNAIFANMTSNDDDTQNELAYDLLKNDSVLALTFVKDSKESYSTILRNLDLVVCLIIACAALLAIIVLYNLTNINITERIREIATIKVLGFYDGEVSSYVFRENILLAIMGDLAGLVTGIYLHKFVIDVAQTDSVMFGRTLPLWTFVTAFIMTIFFAYLVNAIMHYKLKKVSMVESLKSIE